MKILKIIAMAVAATLVIDAIGYLTRTDPIFMLAGKHLDGEEAAYPADWSFTNDHPTIFVESRPDDPHSVTTSCWLHDGTLYIPAQSGSTKSWTHIMDERGLSIETTEFDYKGENQVVYRENGVTITSWPAIHSLDGPVSFALEWNGLKFVFGSDTYPNKWFVEYAKDADLSIHECFVAVPSLIEKFKFTPQPALTVGTQIHTPPEAFGKVMSMTKPRMAVAYHFFKDFDTTASINDRIRSTYAG